MQDQLNRQGKTRSHERREPTFGDIPHNNPQAPVSAAPQAPQQPQSTSQQPLSSADLGAAIGTFSPIEDELDPLGRKGAAAAYGANTQAASAAANNAMAMARTSAASPDTPVTGGSTASDAGFATSSADSSQQYQQPQSNANNDSAAAAAAAANVWQSPIASAAQTGYTQDSSAAGVAASEAAYTPAAVYTSWSDLGQAAPVVASGALENVTAAPTTPTTSVTLEGSAAPDADAASFASALHKAQGAAAEGADAYSESNSDAAHYATFGGNDIADSVATGSYAYSSSASYQTGSDQFTTQLDGSYGSYDAASDATLDATPDINAVDSTPHSAAAASLSGDATDAAADAAQGANAAHEGAVTASPNTAADVSADTAEATSAQDTDAQQNTAPQGNFLYQWREKRKQEKARLQHEKELRKQGLLPKPTLCQRLWHSIKYLFSLGIKLTIVGMCVGCVLFIYFDTVVMEGYEIDDKWVLPAVVYSRPLELYPDQRLSLKQMVYELELLKYRKVESPRNPGEYALNEKNGRLVLVKRPFDFPDGAEPKMSVLVEFDDKRVQRIINADTMQELAFMRMDPVLLDRINRINPEEDRIFISIDEVPQQLITTLIEVEDRAYFQHIGINPLAIGRAFVKNFMAGRVVEGGSTITQQLVKNYFLTNERSYSRKLKEIFMAVAMNHRYTKEQVLEAYMNEIYLGQNGNAGIYGFGLASYFYFGVPVSELNLDQIALLVGLIKGPSYYDPWRFPDHALERRNTVLGILRNRGHISPEQFEKLAAQPIKVIPRGQLSYRKTPAFMGLVKTEIGTRFKEEEERTGKDFLSGNGIRIFTSLDPQAQNAAEKAVTEQIAAIEKQRKKEGLEAAMIVSSWRTGEVSAVVGSADPAYDGYNRVLDSRRQVGSLIKPFVYLTAFHQGYHLGSIVNDSPVKVQLPNGDIWSPKNDDKRFRGPIRVIRAMASSLNVPTVRVGMGAGLDNVVNTLHAAGFKREVKLYPSIVLGTPEISPYELNAMYVGMATEGIYRNLTTLRTIEKNGEIVYQRGSNRSARTLDPKDTYLAIYGMTEATRSGTGRRIGQMFPDVTLATKTGTTNDNRDSWTVGMDSDEIATVWVGFDDNRNTGLYGSSGAMLLYGAYLQERGVNSLDLKRPEGIVYVNFDKQGNVLASGCEEAGMEMYPAREDRIQYVKQCNAFGDSGYHDLPSVVPIRPWNQTPAQQPQQPQQLPPGYQPQNGLQPQFQPAQPTVPQPNNAALNSEQVRDSGARDVDPVRPDENARPTQSSSQNVERQADAFEDELLGIF